MLTPLPESSKPSAKKRSAGAAKLSKAVNAHGAPFWKQKKLEELTPAEWESLCDGCGRCCLVKLEDEDSGRIHFTSIACKLLDTGACRCTDYSRRAKKVRDCIKLTPAKVRELDWLPPACAYRLV
ncbi:MAG TPA: YcgN family cysteine cluster protein, partial [Methylocella sp.]|nr:YcgN family cysteine cluster protein [Methylocella sp.]